MPAFRVRVIEGGKIVLPAAIRQKHGFDVGKTVVVDDSSGVVTVRTLDDVVAGAQAIMAKVASPDRILSDELIAERRAAAP
jgi:bifunctional DNA-binding transcriptional regulator/antitoxin component of YhaV-PrlF toxin-antitoxin module